MNIVVNRTKGLEICTIENMNKGLKGTVVNR